MRADERYIHSSKTLYNEHMNLKTLTGREYTALCREIWREENVRCFNSRLLRCPFFAISDMHFGALHEPLEKSARDLITINQNCWNTIQALRETIVHEMVHQEQHQHKSKYINAEHHGRFFRRRALEILQITGFDVVAMYPQKGTPGFFRTIQP